MFLNCLVKIAALIGWTTSPALVLFIEQVWNSFGCTTLDEYIEIYVKTDILFNLFNYAVFDETMENILKRITIKRIDLAGMVFNANLVTIKLRLFQVFLIKPIYVEMSIIDFVKTIIYDVHYS